MIQHRRAVLLLSIVLLYAHTPSHISAQTPASPAAAPAAAPVLADLRPSPHSFAFTFYRAIAPLNGRYELRQGTLLDFIVTAYGIDHANVVGGPSWIDYDRFDLTVQVPANATRDSANLALRTVLADRFHLVSHVDTRSLPALLLTSARTEPALKPAADTNDPSGCQYQRPEGPPPPPGSPMPASFKFQCRNITMEKFAQNLRMYSGPGSQRPIVDSTHLKGAFDFDITYTLANNGRGLDFNSAVDKQLGLKITPGDAPQPVAVVDSALEKPLANPAGIEKILPSDPPAAFDVATIKPTPADGPRDMNIRFLGPTQVSFSGATLQALIGFAYDISGAMVSGPDYYAKKHWDILGKVAVDDSAPTGPGAQPRYMDVEQLRIMVRSLLADRFQLTGHDDARPSDAYTLYPGTPKMKKADPAARTVCNNGPALDVKDPRAGNPAISRVMICHNITMAQFAAELQYYALDYIKTPVLDLSKVDGSYDFTLYWSSSRIARGVVTVGPHGEEVPVDPSASAPASASGSASAPASATTSASTSTSSEPTGAISLPDAVARQLGLKLILEKRPVPMFVVDHLQESPTEN